MNFTQRVNQRRTDGYRRLVAMAAQVERDSALDDSDEAQQARRITRVLATMERERLLRCGFTAAELDAVEVEVRNGG